MDRIEWNSTLSVGVGILDEQHQQIIAMINLLISNDQATVRSETVSNLLTRLTQYASDHFETEERLLADHGYDELAAQKAEHRAYRIKVVALCQETMSQQESVPAELLRFLSTWWLDHILESDMQYRQFLAEHGVE